MVAESEVLGEAGICGQMWAQKHLDGGGTGVTPHQNNQPFFFSQLYRHFNKMPKVYLLDYVAGNVRSLMNAIEKVGYTVELIKSPEDVVRADVSCAPSILEISSPPHDSMAD